MHARRHDVDPTDEIEQAIDALNARLNATPSRDSEGTLRATIGAMSEEHIKNAAAELLSITFRLSREFFRTSAPRAE